MKFRERIQRFFVGRYGNDRFNRFLSWAALVLLVISLFTSRVWNAVLSNVLWFLGLFLMVYSLYRMLSKNIPKRQRENAKYFALEWKARGWFSLQKKRFAERKAYKYFVCPDCKTKLRVPRHKGRVNVTCKNCGKRFPGRT